MTASLKKIDYRFKILYAFGMILLCVAHATTSNGGRAVYLLTDWFSSASFRLGLFAFCSGYFYKYTAEENPGKYVIKKLKNLILPLYLYNFAYCIIAHLMKYIGFEMNGSIGSVNFVNLVVAPITIGHQFVYNLAGWFVVPLFMVEMYNIFIHKLLHHISKDISETIFFVIGIVLGLTSCYLSGIGYHTGWWLVLVRMLEFIPFYELGIFYKNILEKYDRKIPSFWYFSAVFLVMLPLIYLYGKNHFGKILAYDYMYASNLAIDGIFMPIVAGFLGIAFWMRVATIIEPMIGRSKWINIIADNTYSIMMNHLLGFMIVKTVYALLSKVYIGFSNFDWFRYRNHIYWFYVPKEIYQTLIIYVVVGIAFSIIVQKVVDKVKSYAKNVWNKKTNKIVTEM